MAKFLLEHITAEQFNTTNFVEKIMHRSCVCLTIRIHTQNKSILHYQIELNLPIEIFCTQQGFALVEIKNK